MKSRMEVISALVNRYKWAEWGRPNGPYGRAVRCMVCEETITSTVQATADIESTLEAHEEKHQ